MVPASAISNQWRGFALSGLCRDLQNPLKDNTMDTLHFDPPVSALVGLGFPCRMRTVSAVMTFLQNTVDRDRDEAWEAAMSVCREANSGAADVAEARDVFIAYARRRHILVEDSVAASSNLQ